MQEFKACRLGLCVAADRCERACAWRARRRDTPEFQWRRQPPRSPPIRDPTGALPGNTIGPDPFFCEFGILRSRKSDSGQCCPTSACSCRLSFLGGCAQRQQWLRNNFTAAAGNCVMMGCGWLDGPQLKRKVVGQIWIDAPPMGLKSPGLGHDNSYRAASRLDCTQIKGTLTQWMLSSPAKSESNSPKFQFISRRNLRYGLTSCELTALRLQGRFRGFGTIRSKVNGKATERSDLATHTAPFTSYVTATRSKLSVLKR